MGLLWHIYTIMEHSGLVMPVIRKSQKMSILFTISSVRLWFCCLWGFFTSPIVIPLTIVFKNYHFHYSCFMVVRIDF